MAIPRSLIAILILFFSVFSLYLFTLHPTVSPYRDSGDLSVAAETLGIAHPPGYPLYTLLGKAFTSLVPWGNAGYRMNVMSAFFGAAAAALLGVSALALFSGRLFVLAPVLYLVLSPAFWRLSQVSEMYSLNAFLAAALILLAVRFDDPDRCASGARFFLPAALLCGLAAGNHQTIVLFFPGLLWLFLRGGIRSGRDWRWGALFFAVGLSVYLFLPLRSSVEPLADWGDPGSLHGFLRMLARSDYGGLRLHPEQSSFSWSAPRLLEHLAVFGRSLAAQFTLPGALLGLAGIVLSRKRPFFRFLLVSLLLAGPGFIILSNLPPDEPTTLPILEPHLVLMNVAFTLFILAAVDRLAAFPPARLGLAVLLAFPAVLHAPACRYRTDFYAYDYGRHVLATMERGAILYNPDDTTAFVTTYLTVVEGKRRDVRLAAYFRTRWGYELLRRRFPEILPAREIASGRELEYVLLDHNRGRLPVYAELPAKFPRDRLSSPHGLLNRLSPDGKMRPSGDPFALYGFRNRYRVDGTRDFFTNHVISYYAAARNNLGLSYAAGHRYDAAELEYRRALLIDPGLAAAHNNLGTLAYYRKDYAAAGRWFGEVLRREPGNDSALFNLGLAQKAGGNIAQAEASFSGAWERGNPEAGNELGLLALGRGQAELSAQIFRSVISRQPRFAPAYYNLGLSHLRLGRVAEGRESFRRYLEFVSDPDERAEVMRMLAR